MKAILICLLIGLTLSYSTSGAINYARKYCKNYNSKYNNYAGSGGDSANFISQCIHEGGGQSLSNCKVDRKGMIIGIASLKKCLKEKGWKGYSNRPNSFKAGYPIFLKDSSHAMLATGISGNTIYYCSHNNDRCDYTINADQVEFWSL